MRATVAAGPDLGTVLAGVRRDRLGNGAGAALDEGPLGHLPFDLADVVMQQYIGSARRVRASIGSDRARDAAGRLDLGRLEPFFEQLRDGEGHHLDEVGGSLDVEALQLPGKLRQLEQVGRRLRAHRGRGHEQERPDEPGDLRQVGAEGAARRRHLFWRILRSPRRPASGPWSEGGGTRRGRGRSSRPLADTGVRPWR